MHILIPIFFNAPLGGLHLNVMSTALHCKKNGHDVSVICKEGVFSEKLREENINVIHTNFTDSEYPRTIRKIVELGRTNKIDIIHSHPFQSRKLALLLSRILGVPFFVTIHGKHTDQIETYIDKAAMVFTVSEGIKDFVKEYLTKKGLSKYNHKLYVVPNGVDTELFKPLHTSSMMVKRNEQINISLISRLDQDKEFIINIFYKALMFTIKTYPHNVYWTIVGEGTLKEEIMAKVQEIAGVNNHCVNFAGWKEDIDLLMEYGNSDIVIAPGRCALEAMSCGKPVIAIGSKGYIGLIDKDNWLKGVYTNFGGIGNKIEDYLEGSIENDIKQLVENEMLREDLSELGPNLISLFYEEKEANNNLLRFYRMFQKKNTERIETDKIELENVISSYLIESTIKNTLITPLSKNEYKVKVHCHDYNNIEFAWYIFKDGITMEKIKYSSSNSITYQFKEKGKYRVRCYVKKGQTMFAFHTKFIIIQ
jgi:glycosyltransferase involved in cell wall biosynthesis